MAKLAIDQIEATAGTQVRVKIDQSIVDEYAEAMEAGAIFPGLVVFAPKNSQRYILADGFHRLAACKKISRLTIGVEVKEGGVHEALHYALAANSAHGIRRSNADKANAVQLALKDPHYDDWKLRDIGELCHVSHELVRRVKTEQNEDKDKVKPRKRKAAPTQDQIDRKQVESALDALMLPYDGADAYGRLELVSIIATIELRRDWLNEVLDEHKAQEDGPSE